MTLTPFSSLPLSPITLGVLAGPLQMPTMTDVQSAVLPDALQGRELLVQAKTGTGKTLCFLIPIVERLAGRGQAIPDRSIFALVVTPTRELAQQVCLHAKELYKAHGFRIHAAVGGTNVDRCREQIVGHFGPNHTVVATPGRMLDHLALLDLARKAVRHVQILVLDEVDQVLDLGFWPYLQKLVAHLPPPDKRQTLLFSATVSPGVRRLATQLTRPAELREVTMTPGPEPNVHQHVQQEVFVVPLPALLFTLLTVLRREQRVPGYKVLVFLATARLTEYAAKLFERLDVPAVAIHSKRRQDARERASATFRGRSGVVLFSSDVSSRGMDYPDVSCVVQVGMANSPAQYVHRVGRTARAGKHGRCVVLLADFERPYLPTIVRLGAREGPLPLPEDVDAQVKELTGALHAAGGDPQERDLLHGSFLAFYLGVATRLHADPKAVAGWAAEFANGLFPRLPPLAPTVRVRQERGSKAGYFRIRRGRKPRRSQATAPVRRALKKQRAGPRARGKAARRQL